MAAVSTHKVVVVSLAGVAVFGFLHVVVIYIFLLIKLFNKTYFFKYISSSAPPSLFWVLRLLLVSTIVFALFHELGSSVTTIFC